MTTTSRTHEPRLSATRLIQLATAVSLAGLGLLGCSGRPSRIKPPRINASQSARQAMEMYDQDQDGRISGSELDAAPALKAAMKTLDADGDGQVSAAEIQERIEVWQTTRQGLTSVLCYVTLNGRPLEGATVSFEPEPFLGEEMKAANGMTNFAGVAAPSIPKEDRPTADMPPGLQLGFFKVRVSKVVKGKETLPAKYNTETILGQQIANDDPAIMRHKIVFNLKPR